jgi:hypothetical protein
MPHFGLMDERGLKPEAAALQRARLHIRAGKRRLRQGKTAAGWMTLYDALLFAMEWYVAFSDRSRTLPIGKTENLRDDTLLFNLLQRSGAVQKNFDYEAFKSLGYASHPEESPGYDPEKTLIAFDSLMTRLGVLPFDERSLPPEDPSTY